MALTQLAKLYRAGEFVTGSACSDCFDEIRLDDGVIDPDPRWDASCLEHTLAEYDVHFMHFCFGNKFDTRCYHNGFECHDDDCTCQTTEFGTYPCTLCGNPAHGTREDVVLVRRDQLTEEA